MPSREERPVQRAVLDGLKDMVGGDIIQSGQVSQRAGHFQNPIVGAGAEVEVGHGMFQQSGGFGVDHTMLAQQPRAEGAVAGEASAPVAVLLQRTGRHDAGADLRGAFLRSRGGNLPVVDIRHFHMDINPVEQGAADPLPVARDLHGIAAALAFGIAP